MFLGLIIALCDLRHNYHSEWSPPHHASARATAPTLLRRSLYPNHCLVTRQPPPDARHRPPPPRSRASARALPAPRPGCDGTIVGKPKSPRAGAVQAHDPFCMRRCLCRDPVVCGGAFAATRLYAEVPLPRPGCMRRCLCRDPVVCGGAFAATRVYAEVPLPRPGCMRRCLCRDPVVCGGAFAATRVYAEVPLPRPGCMQRCLCRDPGVAAELHPHAQVPAGPLGPAGTAPGPGECRISPVRHHDRSPRPDPPRGRLWACEK